MAFGLREEDLGDGTQLIELSGDADRLTGIGIEQAFEAALLAGVRRVVLDVSELEFFDSTVLGWILAGASAVRESGGVTIAVCDRPAVRRSLEIKGVDQLIEIVETREQALR